MIRHKLFLFPVAMITFLSVVSISSCAGLRYGDDIPHTGTNQDTKPKVLLDDQAATGRKLERHSKHLSEAPSVMAINADTQQLANGLWVFCEPHAGCARPSRKTPFSLKNTVNHSSEVGRLAIAHDLKSSTIDLPLLTKEKSHQGIGPMEMTHWFVQLGAYRDLTYLQQAMTHLEALHIPYKTHEVDGMNKLRLGEFATQALALEALTEVAPYFPDAFIDHLTLRKDDAQLNSL